MSGSDGLLLSSTDTALEGEHTPKASSSTLATPQSRTSNLRPRKRKRSEAPVDEKPGRPSTSTLLLSLPGLLSVPPNHITSVASYIIALRALRTCVAQESLPPDIECRAWTALAELGFRLVKAGWSKNSNYAWAEGLETDVESAIGKGMVIAQRTPSLAVYKQSLGVLHSRFAHWQQNTKFSRSLLKRVCGTFTFPSPANIFDSPATPSWLIYTTHLTSIAHSLSLAPPDHYSAFTSIDELLSAAEILKDHPVTLLTHVLRLRTLVDAGMWDEVGNSLLLAEGALGMSYDSDETTFASYDAPFEAAMVVHILIMGIVYFTHTGTAKSATKRLAHLHALLDCDALCLFPTGVIEVKLSSGPPLSVKCTHPRTLYHLAYLVSSTSKRDAVGRKPKRKVFAAEGVNIWEKEMKKEVSLHNWADPGDAEEVDERMVKMKADLLSELVAVTIMRSEFEEAESHLATLIAHTRTFDIFDSYAARITLQQAHYAHAVGDSKTARQCYMVASHLSTDGTFVNISARAGHISLQIGVGVTSAEIEDEIHAVVKCCHGMGATLEAIGRILQACISDEILTAKTHLKVALDVASRSQDNHLRGLILALISALYLRTAEKHARSMLESCGQIAAGLGAPPRQSNDSHNEMGTPKKAAEGPVGSAVLGLWVGEQFLEIYKREGNDKKASRQAQINSQLATAVRDLSKRHRS